MLQYLEDQDLTGRFVKVVSCVREGVHEPGEDRACVCLLKGEIVFVLHKGIDMYGMFVYRAVTFDGLKVCFLSPEEVFVLPENSEIC